MCLPQSPETQDAKLAHNLPGPARAAKEISTFELQSFFTYSRAEREFFNARRGNAHKLGLALHIGFLRLTGHFLNTVRTVPANLWRHLGAEPGVTAPELGSLRALYVRGLTTGASV